MATTITSLLNSLHSHLQSQTQLLPTLHTQLGLPPTALADDLSTLQKQLTECVERQIDARRKEVELWMGKCDAVERQCIRYANALGGHGKASGTSVGEIRKEQILPRRFDKITEHQERLRQLYHTKLEQLNTLTNRLHSLSRTLGPEFYPPDIFDPPSNGGPDGEANTELCRDVTPERFSKLEKELVRGKGEISKRLNQLSATLLTIDWLHTELGISPVDPEQTGSSSTLRVPSTRPSSSCSASSSSSDPFFVSSSNLATPTPAARESKPLMPFMMGSSTSATLTHAHVQDGQAPPTPPHEPEAEYQRVFLRFIARLEEIPEEDITNPNKPHAGLEGVEPTPGLISWAESTRVELEEIKRRRESHIQSLYDQLEVLWRRLGVTDQEIDAFVEAQRGSTDATVKAYEEELDRMMELKRERMGTFVENARAEITKLWDDLMVGEQERAEFAPFVDDEFTEDLLTLHDEEIKSLKLERKAKGPLLASIKKYFDILEEQKELAAAAADQTRLLGRGPRGDPGRLLREEKMRKRVTKEKPKLEQDLLNTIPQWEAENGRVFLVHGQAILQVLMNTAAPAHEKENPKKTRSQTQAQTQARQPAAPPRARTPSNPVHQYVPMPGSGHATRNGITRSTSSMSTSTASSSTSNSRSTSVSRRTRLGESTSSTSNALHRSGAHRPPSPKSFGKTSLPAPQTHKSLPRPVPRSVSYQQHQQPPRSVGPSRTGPRTHGYHPYPQTKRASPVKSTTIRVYGSVALNSGASAPRPDPETVAKKSARVRRESFKPRPSVDPGEMWSSSSSGSVASAADKRYAGMMGGALPEEGVDDS